MNHLSFYKIIYYLCVFDCSSESMGDNRVNWFSELHALQEAANGEAR